MKTIKPNNMALMFKTQVLELKDIFSISAFATFNFNLNDPRLLDDQFLWPVVEANLSKDEILDLGIPKPSGEFLVYGSCYSKIPVRGMGVHVGVGSLSKNIVIIGNRQWAMSVPSDAEPFTQLLINYSNAFGGIGYSDNPLGKGYTANADGKIYLPNLEDPNHPITRKSDRPKPVSFTAYPLLWPQRMQYMGKIDDNYIKESWPGFPEGTEPEFFNTAPIDQRLKGFFRGDEEFVINNMHPSMPIQNSKLPGLRVRIFVIQKAQDQEEFKEVKTRADTLWLFPNQEVGALLYRGSIEVADEEYSDISHLYASWENLAEAPKSIEFYYEQLMNEINPPVEVATAPDVELQNESQEDEELQEVSEASEKAPDVKDSIPEMDPRLANSLKEIEKLNAQLKANLQKNNIDPAEVIKDLVPKTNNSPPPLTDLATMFKQMEAQNTDLMKKLNVTKEDVAKMLAKTQNPSQPNLEQTLEQLAKSGGNNAELIKNLTEMDQLNKELQSKLPKLNKDTPEEPAEQVSDELPEEEKPVEIEEPILSAQELTVEDVIKGYAIDKNLSGLDLSNLDLSKLDLSEADFSSSILENTNLENTILDKAVFVNSRINDANFSNSSLNHTVFSETYGGAAKFNQANLTNSNFSNSDFTGCDFSYCNFNNACIKQTTFEQSNFERVQALDLLATEAMFVSCNLTNANFAQANLVNCNLSNAIIKHTNFTGIDAPELKLAGVQGTDCCFYQAKLVGSRADKDTLFVNANFKQVIITEAAWEGTRFVECDLTKATLDNSNFSNGNFNQVKLELALAKKTNFSKAQFTNSDLNRINLFKGTFRRANLNHVDIRYSNLFGVDFYKTEFVSTDLNGANLERTLLFSLE